MVLNGKVLVIFRVGGYSLPLWMQICIFFVFATVGGTKSKLTGSGLVLQRPEEARTARQVLCRVCSAIPSASASQIALLTVTIAAKSFPK